MILFIVAVEFLRYYTAIEYSCQKIYCYLGIIFYGMVEVYP
jgi:hypothetical protein